MEDEKSLETSAVVGKLPDPVENQVNDLLTDGVVASGVVVGGVLLAADHLLGVEQLPVGSAANFVDNRWFQIQEDGSRNMLPSTSLTEEGGEAVIRGSSSLVTRKLTIGLDAVLHAVHLPTSIAHLDFSLTDVDTDTFSHDCLGILHLWR